ncbi:hypothetical protein SKAU_G00349220 [Synaphobranchus kaupii]|uniref:Uncharacterized protein n=1 Tax=Synaphobranchus kaupii TaxID=118154 RepID=A0A9Q1II16_SYNKA|nr:hypothetical protein SKAU_G00349220 [Synaphobranchus kaupii]
MGCFHVLASPEPQTLKYTVTSPVHPFLALYHLFKCDTKQQSETKSFSGQAITEACPPARPSACPPARPPACRPRSTEKGISRDISVTFGAPSFSRRPPPHPPQLGLISQKKGFDPSSVSHSPDRHSREHEPLYREVDSAFKKIKRETAKAPAAVISAGRDKGVRWPDP